MRKNNDEAHILGNLYQGPHGHKKRHGTYKMVSMPIFCIVNPQDS